MSTSQTQLTITFSENIMDLLKAKADSLGVSVTAFVKKVITKEAREEVYPKFKASKATIREAKQAMKDYEAGKAVDASVFFKQLNNES